MEYDRTVILNVSVCISFANNRFKHEGSVDYGR
jgi:hypothetical protein